MRPHVHLGRVRCRVVVSGRVQGVWFRESCRRRANELGVAGWVRNRPDGKVEAVFDGPEDDVAKVIAWCRMGPPAADVTGIDVTVIDLGGEDAAALPGFAVR